MLEDDSDDEEEDSEEEDSEEEDELSDSEKEKVSHGMGVNTNLENGIALLTQQNKLIAVANIENKKAKILKVFI